MKRRVAVAAAASILVLACCGGRSGGPLSLTDDPGGSCRGPTGVTTWSVLQQRATVFGLDSFSVDTKKPIVVRSVELVGGLGGLRVVNAAFVPGAGIGVFNYAGTATTYGPTNFRARISMPGAILTQLHPTAAQLAADPSARDYQLVVAVVPTKEFASASAAHITYTVGGKTWQLTGRQFVAVTRNAARTCEPTPGTAAATSPGADGTG